MKLKAKETEAGISKAIREYLAAEKIPYWRMNSGMMLGSYTSTAGKSSRWKIQLNPPGTADILCSPKRKKFVQGWPFPVREWLWLEVKRPDGVQSPEQRGFEQQVKAWGMEYAVVRSVDDLVAVLGRL